MSYTNLFRVRDFYYNTYNLEISLYAIYRYFRALFREGFIRRYTRFAATLRLGRVALQAAIYANTLKKYF